MSKGSPHSAPSEEQTSACPCFNPPFSYLDFDSKMIGVDETHGRFGEVSVETCKHCRTKWLRYFVEYEAFSESGRWYRGLISDRQLAKITPETAVAFLERLPWNFVGGSYFRTRGRRSSGHIYVDL